MIVVVSISIHRDGNLYRAVVTPHAEEPWVTPMPMGRDDLIAELRRQER
jgi:hypothetical protein